MIAGDVQHCKQAQKVDWESLKQAPKGMEMVNLNAAGIDLGSEHHYVAVPEGRSGESVRCFGPFIADIRKMADWLKECSVDTVAMESTGVYWVPVFQVLESQGLEVLLVDARRAKNVPGRKTDVLDCQWLQKLHTFGLLSSCHIARGELAALRHLWRQRADLVEGASRSILHMQKALEQMGLQIHKVLSDISGVSGMKIMRAIVEGERSSFALAALCHAGVKASQEDILKALSGNWRRECLFALGQALSLFDTHQQMLCELDGELEAVLSGFESKADPSELAPSRKGRRRKNEVHFDLRSHLFRVTGVDLTAIDGIEAMTAQTIISECGVDLKAFPTEKHFSSWLGLCPNHTITGSRVRKRSSRKVQSPAAKALRLAAQSLERSSSALGGYYRRMKARLGAPKAITAAAHKLACLIYRMIRFGMSYVDKGQEHYEERFRQQELKRLQRRAKNLGLALLDPSSGQIVS